MPAKKEAVALQKELLNQEQWDEMLAVEGLTVIDIYQKWCGPCKAVQGLFRRLKNEIGDDLLHYATAEADSIEALERYRGRCEPCFLFYGGGELIDVVRGASAPGLQKSITHQLAAEHKVIEGGAERKVIKDPILAAMEKQEKAAEIAAVEEQKRLEEEAMNVDEIADDISMRPVSEGKVRRFFEAEGSEPVPKQVTIVLIKPDAVKAEKTQEIIEKINSQGMEILVQEERTLREDEAREFYKDQEGEDHFEDLVKFMASGPSVIMVLTKGDTGEGVVEEVREVIGPKDVELAKTDAPDSLRAIFGTDKTMNALHGADSAERAARELSFFFPSFVVPNVPGTGPPPKIEKTLALIRPEALKQHKDSIIEKIHEAGFEVCLQKEIQLTEEQAKEFYKEQEGQDHYEELIKQMIAGPVLALGLAKEEAIQGWRSLLGPKEVAVAKAEAPDSLRGQFSITDSRINAIHGSDSLASAEKELEMFFPKEHTLAVIKPDATGEHRDAIIERITEAGFNIACQKDVHMDQDLATQLYKEHEGKEFYESLINHMTSGPSMVMVLSREDAIDNWRTLMGPTDPEIAKEQAPDSLRALLGKDILHNAIHGSSTKEHAVQKIKELFPEVEVTETGNIRDDDADGETKKESGEGSNEEPQGIKENSAVTDGGTGQPSTLAEKGSTTGFRQTPSEISDDYTPPVSESESEEKSEAEMPAAASPGQRNTSTTMPKKEKTKQQQIWKQNPRPPSERKPDKRRQPPSKKNDKKAITEKRNPAKPTIKKMDAKKHSTKIVRRSSVSNGSKQINDRKTPLDSKSGGSRSSVKDTRTTSARKRDKTPSRVNRAPSARKRDRTPSKGDKADRGTSEVDKIASASHSARTLSPGGRTSSQGYRTPSASKIDRTVSQSTPPSASQGDRASSATTSQDGRRSSSHGDNPPSQGTRTPSVGKGDTSIPSADERGSSKHSASPDLVEEFPKETSAPVETNAPVEDSALVEETSAPEAREEELNESENNENKVEEEGTETAETKADGSDPVDAVEEPKEEAADAKEVDAPATDAEAQPEESKPEGESTDEIKTEAEEPKPEEPKAEDAEEQKAEVTEEAKTEGEEEPKTEGVEEPTTENAEETKEAPDEAKTETSEEPKAETTENEQPPPEAAADEKNEDSAEAKPEDDEAKPTEHASVESAGGD